MLINCGEIVHHTTSYGTTWLLGLLEYSHIYEISYYNQFSWSHFSCFILPEDGAAPTQEEEEAGEAGTGNSKRKQFKTEKQKSREFEVEGDILKPEFMDTKSMVDYAPAEISAVEQYEASLAEQAERKVGIFAGTFK